MPSSFEKRLSLSSLPSPPPAYSPPSEDVTSWIDDWGTVFARDLMTADIGKVDDEISVEEACDRLLQLNKDTGGSFLAIHPKGDPDQLVGLFDFADVNAFLTLAATRHQLPPDDKRGKEIVHAAIQGKVPVHLVSDLSEKNPLASLSYSATIIDLLGVFSTGLHRYIGSVTDAALLSYFQSYALQTPSFATFLSYPFPGSTVPRSPILSALYSCHPHAQTVVSCPSNESVLGAMKKMSREGVSSVAVLSEGALLSAVSVTDIGRIVVPSEDNQILSQPLHHLISLIKEPYGSQDGAEKYPVYAVQSTNRLGYIIEKLLATNAHRLFISSDDPITPGGSTTLRGVLSIVDILSLFARLAKIPNVDPGSMRNHRRRASSSAASTHSSSSDENRRSKQLS